MFLAYALFLAGVRIPRQGMDTEGVEAEEEATVSSNLAVIKAAALDPGLLRWALVLPLLDMPVKAFVVLYFHVEGVRKEEIWMMLASFLGGVS